VSTKAFEGETEAWSRAALAAFHGLAVNQVDDMRGVENLAERFEAMLQRRAVERRAKAQAERDTALAAAQMKDEANVAKVLATGVYVSTDSDGVFEVVDVIANEPPPRALTEFQVLRTLGVAASLHHTPNVKFVWSNGSDKLIDVELFGCSPTDETWAKLEAAGLPVCPRSLSEGRTL